MEIIGSTETRVYVLRVVTPEGDTVVVDCAAFNDRVSAVWAAGRLARELVGGWDWCGPSLVAGDTLAALESIGTDPCECVFEVGAGGDTGPTVHVEPIARWAALAKV